MSYIGSRLHTSTRSENLSPTLSISGRRSILFWLLAVVCWINDRVFCSLWSGLGFPYLHAAWHVLVFLASYTAVVIFAFFEAKSRNGLRAEIRLVV